MWQDDFRQTRSEPLKFHFEQFLEFRRAAIKASTAETYRTDQAAFFRWADARGLTVQSITRSNIAEWMAHAQSSQSNGTIMSRLAILRSFLAWAEDQGLRVGNPVEIKKLPRLKSPPADRQPFTEDEFRRLLQAAEGHPFWAPAIQIGWFSGLRMGDVAGLLWAEVDLQAGIITRRAMKTSQTHAPKVVPIDPELRFVLIRLYNGPEREGSLFVLPAMQSLYQQARTQLCEGFKRLSGRAGVQNGHFHRLRHSFVSKLINAGVSTVTIQSMTGQSLPVLAKYAHVSTEAKREALAKASSLPQNAISLLTNEA